MAKTTITIEDLPGGKVKIEAQPSYEILMKKVVANQLTAGDGYTLALLNTAIEISKSNRPGRIIIPRHKPGLLS